MSKGTPPFTLRLASKTKADLVEMAKLYGSPNGSAFAREMIEVMVSGDIERVKQFNGRLIAKAGEQMTLKMNAAMDALAEPKKLPLKAKRKSR